MELVLFLMLIAVIYYWIWRPNKRLKPLPTPAGSSLIFGHFFQIGQEPHKKFAEWAKTLGDVYTINMGRQRWIILNSDKAVSDLFQKRGAKYSSRAPNYIANEVLERNRNFGMSQYNDWYKKMSPILHEAVGAIKIKSYENAIETVTLDIAKRLLLHSLTHPRGVYPKTYFKLGTTNIMLAIAFARSPLGTDDPLFRKLERVKVKISQQTDLCKIRAEFFPLFSWILNLQPYNDVLRIRDEYENLIVRFLHIMYKENSGKPCIARELMAKKEARAIDAMDVVHLLGNFFSAGTDTVAASLTWLVALLCNNPDIQSEAHTELDKIIGHDRLPTLKDEPKLPYIRALAKETLRFCPPKIIGLPHYIEEDDEYQGYHIPKNSVVILNTYSIHFNKRRYPKPYKFDPKRFMGSSQGATNSATCDYEKREHFAFGAGKRTCVGIHLAEAELYMTISLLLWCFRIESDGDKIPVDLAEYQYADTFWPEEYNVRFVPRHANVKRLLFGKI